MERRLTAILAADVVGYSAMMERDEAGTFERVATLRQELLEPLFALHNGRIFKVMGDGFLAEFPSAVDAVQCAVALQRGLADRDKLVPTDQRLEMRVGVNLGDVIIEGEDRYGEGVNIAARLEQIAGPGDIYVSDKVAKEVGKKLEFDLEALGRRRVKNIAEPVPVFRVKVDAVRRLRRSVSRAAGRGTWLIICGSLLVMIAIAGVVVLERGWWASQLRSDRPSVAVLPFATLSDDAKWIRIAGGITEDIITDLSQSRALVVIAASSSDSYKTTSVEPREVGSKLGVNYVLKGSLQSSDDHIRIAAQLIKAGTGESVWSERYDRSTEDIFAVQNDVTEKIAASLTGYESAIAGAELKLIKRKPPSSLTAYETYLMGMEVKHRLSKENLIEAERLFNKAIELDPELARAYVGLVYVYNLMLNFGLADSPEQVLSKQINAAKRAVELDPNDGDAHLALGTANAYHGKAEQALAEFDKAEALAPNNADLLLQIAWFIPSYGQEQCDRAVTLADRALSLNPSYPDWYDQALAFVYFFGKRFDASAKHAKLIKNPFALEYALLAMSDVYLGRPSDAATAAGQVTKLDPRWNAERYLSDTGGFAEPGATLFVEGAWKAGIPSCVSASDLNNTPALLKLQWCDQQRAKSSTE